MLGSGAAEVSFQIGCERLWDLAGLRIDAKQVERIAKRLGLEMAEHERQDTTAFVSTGDLPPTSIHGH